MSARRETVLGNVLKMVDWRIVSIYGRVKQYRDRTLQETSLRYQIGMSVMYQADITNTTACLLIQ